jgi:hypothetical protein
MLRAVRVVLDSMSFIFSFWFFVFVVAVVASIWDDNLTNLISRQQLFFKKMKIFLKACGAA